MLFAELIRLVWGDQVCWAEVGQQIIYNYYKHDKGGASALCCNFLQHKTVFAYFIYSLFFCSRQTVILFT